VTAAGTIVWYQLTSADADQVTTKQDGNPLTRALHRVTTAVTPSHPTEVSAGQQLPMIVVTTDTARLTIAGHVFLPGGHPSTLWVPAATEGTAPGQYTTTPPA
jgi:hypothetical protein